LLIELSTGHKFKSVVLKSSSEQELFLQTNTYLMYDFDWMCVSMWWRVGCGPLWLELGAVGGHQEGNSP